MQTPCNTSNQIYLYQGTCIANRRLSSGELSAIASWLNAIKSSIYTRCLPGSASGSFCFVRIRIGQRSLSTFHLGTCPYYLRLLNVKPTHQSRTNHVRLVELNGHQLTDVVEARSIGTWQICHRHVNIFGDIMEEIAELPSEDGDVALALVIGSSSREQNKAWALPKPLGDATNHGGASFDRTFGICSTTRTLTTDMWTCA